MRKEKYSAVCDGCIHYDIGDEKVNNYTNNARNLLLKIQGWSIGFDENNKDVDISWLSVSLKAFFDEEKLK